MRFHYLLLFCCLFTVASLSAQDYKIHDSNLQVRNFKFEHEVYIPEMGTKGVMFIFEYYYTTPSKYLVTFPQQISAYKYGVEVFKDTSSYLVMRPNQWNKARKFIPYREINVPEGKHNDLEVNYSVDGVIDFKGIMQFDQPPRYAVNLKIDAAQVKPRAGNWDTGSPKDWAADMYWRITTDEGVFPAYESKVAVNQNRITDQEATFFVLEGEKLFLNFYDDDGSEDEKLGSYELSVADSDLKKSQLGRMFGNMMGVNYTLGQRRMIRQPISTYVRKDYKYLNREGVQVIFDYFLPKAFEGRVMKPMVQYTNKQGKKINLEFFYNLDNAPRPGQKVELSQQGKIAYFIPHYAWNPKIQQIEFAFVDGQDRAEAAPYFIHNPVEFSKPISYSGFYVEDDYKYLGTSGVRMGLSYKVKDLHKYSKLELNFLNMDGSPVEFDVYPIEEGANTPNPIPNNPYSLSNPQQEDTLFYFIPFTDLPVNRIRIEMNMVPDMSIPLVHENSPLLEIPEQSLDGKVEKVKEESVFKQDAYGFVVSIKCDIPGFYKDRCLLDVQAKRNGVHFLGYSVVSDMVEELAVDTFKLNADTGMIYVIFPYRRLEANDKIEVACKLIEKKRGLALSEPVTAEVNLPSKVYNVETVISLKSLLFDDSVPDDDDYTNYKYVLTVGNEVKLSKTLPPKVKGRELSDKYTRTVRVHREDLIQIKVVDKKDEENEIFLWSGDLGKFQQNKFKSKISSQVPVKKAMVKASASKKQLTGE